MLACVLCSCLRTSTGLSISKCGGLKCLPPPCDARNFGWIIGIDVLGFEVFPPTCGCLAIYLGFEVSPPTCGCLVILLGF